METNVIVLPGSASEDKEQDYAVVWSMMGCEIIPARSEAEARARFRFFSEYYLAENRNDLVIDEIEAVRAPKEGDGS